MPPSSRPTWPPEPRGAALPTARRPQRRPAGAPDPPFPQHKICTPLTLEMYYTELDPEHHRSLLAAIGAYPVGRKLCVVCLVCVVCVVWCVCCMGKLCGL